MVEEANPPPAEARDLRSPSRGFGSGQIPEAGGVTRISLKSVNLDIESRRRIYDFILSSPGAHLREIQRALEMPMGVLGHHLNYLEEHEIISAKMDRYYKRYYPSTIGVKEKTLLSALRQERPRAIVLHLMLNPGQNHRDIMAHFDLSPSTLSFYLKDLQEKCIINKLKMGRESVFDIVSRDEVVRVLITYKPSFLDVLVDRFLEIWFEKKKE